MLKLHVVQARDGDCLFLEYGKSTSKFMMIDGGPSYSKELKAKLLELRGGKIDAAVISHIDNDHIEGVRGLLEDIKAGKTPVRIGGIWHNSLSQAVGESSETVVRTISGLKRGSFASAEVDRDMMFGVPQAEKVEDLATADLGIPINDVCGGKAITTESASQSINKENISIQIIGPTRENYRKLVAAWEKIKKKETQRLVAADTSPWNLSSIMFLVSDSKGHKILFTGDGLGKDIVKELSRLKLLENKRIHVNILKVPHHGSNRNSDEEFFATVTADTYVISANTRHENPDPEVLRMIASQAKKDNRRFKFVFTNKTECVNKVCDELEKEGYDFAFDFIAVGRSSLEVDLGV